MAIAETGSSKQAEVATEQTPLLQDQNGAGTATYGELTTQDHALTGDQDANRTAVEDSTADDTAPGTGIYATLSVLLVGVFISQTDQSLVIATYAKVASEFNDLSAGSWLISAYILAQCVAQPLYGKLSEIYGRKTCLQAAYVLFALGTLGSGLGRGIGEVIAARAIQGLGGAGMVSMVSIIITDIVPVHEVGTLRSYVNILQTTGRGCGGVIGGYLTETIGWRWAFLVQVPPTLLAILLVQWRLQLKPTNVSETHQTSWAKLKRVDFIGAFFLCLTVGSFCFVLDRAGTGELSLQSPIAIAFIVTGGVSLIAFIISGNYAVEPIFPLRLWTQRAVVTNYAIVALQTAMQISSVAAVPLVIQATHDLSTAQVGAALIPAFLGNTIGGLLAGYWVKRTRTHKPITIFGAAMGSFAMVLCITTWQGEGFFNFARSLVIFPGGFSVGVVSSSAFVALAAGVLPGEVAIAGSGMYMFFNIGAILGISLGSVVYQTTLASALPKALDGVAGKETIIRRALQDVSYVRQTDDGLRALLVPCFVAAFHNVNYMGLILSGLSVLSAILSPSSRLLVPKQSDDEQQEPLPRRQSVDTM
ncbi:hypothetical protein AMS68_007507 [Peltaster fructicola]|uniref:Major facilitator superfamily (MFS) profile domain-containing protein n=1 Tax=Peltaster fructicola TaxID=286661 RepID=A0A6H0Y5X3_9PEZI|nr:hypothetical protein AMS68_007507 [Peltaster fructicola]